jgi:NADH-quinone oxidoreductase subunit E
MSREFGKVFDRVCDILDRYERKPNNLIAILHEVQEIYSYLPEDIMAYVATALEVSPTTVFGVATFYSHFTLEPQGKNIVKVCDGTACHVRKSEDIIRTLRKEMGLADGRRTSDDMLFTLEIVACLGVCGLAPVVVVNDEVHGAMTPEMTKELIQTVRARGASQCQKEVCHA